MNIFKVGWIRWIAWTLLTVLFAIACVILASWQLERREEAVAKVTRVASNYDRDPIQIGEIQGLNQLELIDYEWHPIALEGEYLTERELLVRNRPIAGSPGFIQLVPIRLETGSYLLVERGWIQADSDLNPSKSFAPTATNKTLTARLRLTELSPNRPSPTGQVTSINLVEIEGLLNLDIETNFYLQLISESPAEDSYPQALGKPILDEGNHLSYAIQWIIFATMGFGALIWAYRQELEFRRMERDPDYVPRRKAKAKNDDADIEDEIIETGGGKVKLD